jgi:PKHD-type hydroxylase
MLYQIPQRHLYTADTHAYHDAIFTSAEIDKILALPEWLNSNTATVGGAGGAIVVNTEIRVSHVAWLNPTQNTFWIWEKIVNAAANINSEFFNYDLTGCYEPIQLGVYKSEENGNYDWHIDASMRDRNTPRKLSMSLVLSDPSEYEGGELQIKTESDTPITLNCPKGRAWFFPSFVLHRVAPVTKGVRRSLVLWMSGPAFK